jgi:hypothetical protein
MRAFDHGRNVTIEYRRAGVNMIGWLSWQPICFVGR